MPTHSRAIALNLTRLEPLADLFSVAEDLRLSEQLCDEALRYCGEKPLNFLLIEALVSVAIIRYCRCFSTSPRLGLRHVEVERLGKRVALTHRHIRALRDKFVAHCLSPLEETWVTAVASTRDGELLPITSLGFSSHRVVLAGGEAEGLRILVRRVRRYVDAKVEKRKIVALRIVQRMPIPDVHKGDLHPPMTYDPRDVHRTRKQTVAPKARLAGSRRRLARGG